MLDLLTMLAFTRLPCRITDAEMVDRVRGLKAAQLIEAQIAGQRAQAVATVTQLTTNGETLLQQRLMEPAIARDLLRGARLQLRPVAEPHPESDQRGT